MSAGEQESDNGRITNGTLKRDIGILTRLFEDSVIETKVWRKEMEIRVRVLEDARLIRQAESQGWSWVKAKIIVPALNYGVALILGWIFLKVSGQLP